MLTIQSDDYEWLHGRGRKGVPSDVQLGPWIDENYRLMEEIPKFGTVYIYKRKDLVETTTQQAKVTNGESRLGWCGIPFPHGLKADG